MFFEREAFEKELSHEGGPLVNGISALKEEARELAHPLSAM